VLVAYFFTCILSSLLRAFPPCCSLSQLGISALVAPCVLWHNTRLHWLLQATVCIVHDDERPVRQLRGTAHDRCCRFATAQTADQQDPSACRCTAKVHVWQAYSRQAGEVLHEEQR